MYFAVVRDENCSGLKAAASSKVYGSEVVSSTLLVHAQWTRFSALVTHICTVPGIGCEMWNDLQESSNCLVFSVEGNVQKYSKRV
jgi:hypothetical protein